MIQVADVGKGHRGAHLDTNARREVSVFHIVVPDLNCVNPFGDWASRPSHSRWWWGRPQWPQLPVQGKRPHCVTVCTATQLVPASSDGDILLAVHLVGHG